MQVLLLTTQANVGMLEQLQQKDDLIACDWIVHEIPYTL